MTDLDKTTVVRKAQKSEEAPKSNNKNRFGKKKSKLPGIIVTVLVIALLVGGGFFAYPIIKDSITKETTNDSTDNSTNENDKQNGDNRETADYSKGDNEKIALILAEADSKAKAGNLEGAITELQKGLVTYPKSAKLQEKLDEYSQTLMAQMKQQTLNEAEALAEEADFVSAMAVIEEAQKEAPDDEDYKKVYESYLNAHEEKLVNDAMKSAEELAEQKDYKGAIKALEDVQGEIEVNKDLIVKLENKNKEYNELLIAQEKQKVLEEAEAFAEKEDYQAAMNVIKTAQSERPDDKDYEKKYETYLNAYNDKVKTDALKEAEVLAQSGNNLGAMNTVKSAMEIVGNDVELQTAIDTYKKVYITKVIDESNTYLTEEKYDEANALVEDALVAVPNESALTEQKTYIASQKPKDFLTECPPYESLGYKNYSNGAFMMAGEEYTNGFCINQEYGHGNSYVLCNLKGKYSELQFDVGHIDKSAMSVAVVNIYLDGEYYNKYTISPESLPFHVSIPLKNKRQIKFVLEVVDWPVIGFANMKIK